MGAEHILDREVPFPAIWGVCKAKNSFVRSAPTDGGAPLDNPAGTQSLAQISLPNIFFVPPRLQGTRTFYLPFIS